MFKKTDKNLKAYKEAYDNINKEDEKKSADKIVFREIMTDLDCKIIANNLLNSNPVVVNFANIDREEANKHLAFLTGVIYALSGEIIRIRDKVYMFAKKEEFLDGTLKQFIDDIDL